MATSTDMKGNVVKMEVDYSDTVDKRIPECEKLTTVGSLRFDFIFLNWRYFFKTICVEHVGLLSWLFFRRKYD